MKTLLRILLLLLFLGTTYAQTDYPAPPPPLPCGMTTDRWCDPVGVPEADVLWCVVAVLVYLAAPCIVGRILKRR